MGPRYAILVACLLNFFVWALPAGAGQLTLRCDNNSTGATSYRLYRSLDAGTTWVQIAEVPTPAGTVVDFVIQAEDGQLVLYRATAVKADTPLLESLNSGKGAWYDSRQIQTLPPAARGLRTP